MPITAIVALSAIAQAPDVLTAETYIRPPQPIEDAVMAPWYRNTGVTGVSPDGKRFVVLERQAMIPLSWMGKPYVNLAGQQIDISAQRDRSLTTRANLGIKVVGLADGKTVTVKLPKGATVSAAAWSPDGSKLAFFAHFEDKSLLYVADPNTGNAKPAADRALMPTLADGFQWLGDSNRLVAMVRPKAQEPMPQPPILAESPDVRMTDPRPNALRTYPSLLRTPYDQRLLDYFATAQLAILDSRTGKVQEVGAPSRITSFSAMLDGSCFRVSMLEKPWSYIVPLGNFPTADRLIDAQGKQLVEVDKTPLRLGEAPDPSPTPSPTPGNRPARPTRADDSRRSLMWRPDGSGLGFLQLSPAKDATGATVAKRKDRVMQWLPPFRAEDAKVVWETDDSITSVSYSADCQTLFLTVSSGTASKQIAVRLKEGAKTYTLRDTVPPPADAQAPPRPGAGDAGNLMTRPSAAGSVVRMSNDGKFIYYSGTIEPQDPDKDAPKPYIDRMEIEPGKRTRIFESKPLQYETAILTDDDATGFVVTRQSPTTVPNAFLVTGGSERQITDNKDYLPDLTQCQKRSLTVTRADGMKLRVEILLPRDWKPGTRLPAFFWFYPNEYRDQAAYDRTRRSYNKNLFPTVGTQSKTILLRAGYAVVNNDCPIFGAPEKVNDSYIPQLRNNLAATIDALDAAGYIDRSKLAIGGHSYGAFSTANALIHTPFFKAGIAGDGCYLRPLTPFGFQSEQRMLWDGRELYTTMSPLLYAEQMTGALLMYHGLDDQNVGTAPINSIRMFGALEALGKRAALYMYPYEDHGQAARETILDEWARFVAWLDKYVKGT